MGLFHMPCTETQATLGYAVFMLVAEHRRGNPTVEVYFLPLLTSNGSVYVEPTVHGLTFTYRYLVERTPLKEKYYLV